MASTGGVHLASVEGDPLIIFYGAGLTDTTAHVQDIGECFEFIYQSNWRDYPPLAAPGAPSSGALLGGAFFHDKTIFLVGANATD